MPAILLPILGKILPYILGAIAVIGAYLGFKHKITVKAREEERAKIETEQRRAVAEQRKAIEAAIQKDRTIDKTVGEKIDAVKPKPVEKPAEDYKPGDVFKF